MAPRHQGHRRAYQTFGADELLYRRVKTFYVHDGQIDPVALSFKRPLSTLRSAEATPEDALHPDCAGGKAVLQQIAISFPVSVLPPVIEDDAGKEFVVFLNHKPEPTCFAHTDLWCLDASTAVDQSDEISDLTAEEVYREPPPKVRNRLRSLIAEHHVLHEN